MVSTSIFTIWPLPTSLKFQELQTWMDLESASSRHKALDPGIHMQQLGPVYMMNIIHSSLLISDVPHALIFAEFLNFSLLNN